MLNQTYEKLENTENVDHYYIYLWSWLTGNSKEVARFNSDFKSYAFSDYCDLINNGYTCDFVAVTRKGERIILNPVK